MFTVYIHTFFPITVAKWFHIRIGFSKVLVSVIKCPKEQQLIKFYLPEIAGELSSFFSLSTVSSIIFIPSSCSCIASNFNLSFAAIFSRFAARNFRFALERMLFAIFEFSTCLMWFSV